MHCTTGEYGFDILVLSVDVLISCYGMETSVARRFDQVRDGEGQGTLGRINDA